MRPPIDGAQVMEHLGSDPGRVVGEALELPDGAADGARTDLRGR